MASQRSPTCCELPRGADGSKSGPPKRRRLLLEQRREDSTELSMLPSHLAQSSRRPWHLTSLTSSKLACRSAACGTCSAFVEAGVAITAGVIASSIALVGFGLDSVIGLFSAGIVVWQQ